MFDREATHTIKSKQKVAIQANVLFSQGINIHAKKKNSFYLKNDTSLRFLTSINGIPTTADNIQIHICLSNHGMP